MIEGRRASPPPAPGATGASPGASPSGARGCGTLGPSGRAPAQFLGHTKTPPLPPPPPLPLVLRCFGEGEPQSPTMRGHQKNRGHPCFNELQPHLSARVTINLGNAKTNILWMDEILHLRNPGKNRFPCKYQPCMVSTVDSKWCLIGGFRSHPQYVYVHMWITI